MAGLLCRLPISAVVAAHIIEQRLITCFVSIT
jgi:hypothetical protein